MRYVADMMREGETIAPRAHDSEKRKWMMGEGKLILLPQQT